MVQRLFWVTVPLAGGTDIGSVESSLDLRAVRFMDTSGLRLVISEQQRAHAGGYRFAVVPGSDRVKRLFEIAGFPAGHPLFAGPPAERAGG